jgi:hypothetical protein
MWGTCDVCGKPSRYMIVGPGTEACADCLGFARAILETGMREACYGDLDVTLDGKAARISGFENDLATVGTSEAACEWTWAAVAWVAARGGQFASNGPRGLQIRVAYRGDTDPETHTVNTTRGQAPFCLRL